MKNMIKLSVVINTKNSAETLERTLKSIKWVDEIVVVDMASKDDTVKISKKFTKKIFQYPKPNIGYVEPARNMAVKKATGEWILVLDADEEVPLSLKEKIQQLISGDATADAYHIPRKNIVFNQWYQHAGWWPDYQLRLFKKGAVEWSGVIHQPPTLSGKSDSLAPQEDMAIIHHNYQSIDQYLGRLNRYTTHEADNRSAQMITSSSVVESFTSELLSRLFHYRGIDGGLHGVAISFLQSFYEQAVLLKQWEKDRFTVRKKEQQATIKSLRNFQSELNYWIADWHVSHAGGLSKIYWQIRRKLMI
jgi:glycosyltransferase involved in cell wall biosynthesis